MYHTRRLNDANPPCLNRLAIHCHAQLLIFTGFWASFAGFRGFSPQKWAWNTGFPAFYPQKWTKNTRKRHSYVLRRLTVALIMASKALRKARQSLRKLSIALRMISRTLRRLTVALIMASKALRKTR